MADSKAFYLTTPIYYVNDAPHIGHAQPDPDPVWDDIGSRRVGSGQVEMVGHGERRVAALLRLASPGGAAIPLDVSLDGRLAATHNHADDHHDHQRQQAESAQP